MLRTTLLAACVAGASAFCASSMLQKTGFRTTTSGLSSMKMHDITPSMPILQRLAASVWPFQNTAFGIDLIPEGAGKLVIVTGANAGLGLTTTTAFARAGYTVIMACRSKERGEEALRSVRNLGLKGEVILELVDLAEPASIHAFAARIQAKYDRLHILFNNAAVMGLPETRYSRGWEMQFATGHLGHFILTSRLFVLLQRARGRVVNVSSIADLLWTSRKYDPFGAYCSTKRANLLFTHELNARFASAGVSATAAHPGFTFTDIYNTTGFSAGGWRWLHLIVTSAAFNSMIMDSDNGALSQIRAAVDASADDLIGPALFVRGPPVLLGTSLQAWWNPLPFRADDAAALWRQSEEITGELFASAWCREPDR